MFEQYGATFISFDLVSISPRSKHSLALSETDSLYDLNYATLGLDVTCFLFESNAMISMSKTLESCQQLVKPLKGVDYVYMINSQWLGQCVFDNVFLRVFRKQRNRKQIIKS